MSSEITKNEQVKPDDISSTSNLPTENDEVSDTLPVDGNIPVDGSIPADGSILPTEVAKEPEQEEHFSLSDDEFFAVARGLNDKHSLFYKFWEIGQPIFTKTCPTAAIHFDKETGSVLGFYFNTDLWKTSSFKKKTFIICHEMLHVAFNHGSRTKDSKNKQLMNVALDIVVNHTLTKRFGFNRKFIEGAMDYCWIDTVKDKDDKLIFVDDKGNPDPDDKNFEFYYNKLMKARNDGRFKYEKGQPGSGQGDIINLPGMVDDHDSLSDDDREEIIKELNNRLSNEAKENLRDVIEKNYQNGEKKGNGQPGSPTGIGKWMFVDPSCLRVVRKKKWETVIRNWVSKTLVWNFKDVEQWAREPRRMQDFLQSRKDSFLSSEMECEVLCPDKKKIDVVLVLDTSGSCIHLAERFWKAGASIPPEKFNLQLYCFDTECYATTLASKKIYGGGGTSFSVIEQRIQKDVKEGKLHGYPKAVFVITDGYSSDHVKPEKPKNWFWFLTENYKNYVPKESKTFNLEDFE